MPTRRDETLGMILQQGLVPNLVNDRLDPVDLAGVARDCGVRCLEVSCTRPDTLAVLGRLKAAFPDMRFGVSGMVESGPYFDFLQRRGPRFPSVDEAADAGADFLVSILPFAASTYVRHGDLPIIPGIATPEDARVHLDLGAALIKYPLTATRDPAVVKAMFHSAPMHLGVPLLLTGGLRPAVLDDFVSAGMLVAVAGFDLILGDGAAARPALTDYLAALTAARARHLPGVDFAGGDAWTIQEQSGRFMNVSRPA